MTELIKINVSRMSVCIADDVTAPNATEFNFAINLRIKTLVSQIKASVNLPLIFGERATWIVKNEERVLAVIAQEWKDAKFIVDPDSWVSKLKLSNNSIHIYLDYAVQEDPEVTYQRLIRIQKL